MASNKPTILIVGTLDTKLPEILFLRDRIIAAAGEAVQTKVLDVSRNGKPGADYPAIPASEVLSPLLDQTTKLASMGRIEYVDTAVATCLPVVRELLANSQIHGVISAAGSAGILLAAAIMKEALPIGFPKVLVSPFAGGDIRSYIEDTDITTVYSVVDIAGVNSILMQILTNAAGAIVGMTLANVLQTQSGKKVRGTVGRRIAITTSDLTMPCVNKIQTMLTSTPHDVSSYEIYTFPADGLGGRAMERLIRDGEIDALIDLTTTDLANEAVLGVDAIASTRLEAAVQNGIPIVLSTGACDTVAFGHKHTIPEAYTNRNLHIHDETTTFVRTTPAENEKIGESIVGKLKHTAQPSRVRVVLPQGGISELDRDGQPFHDPAANAALFETINTGLDGTEIEVVERVENINDDEFAKDICETLLGIMEVDPRKYRLANARRRQWSFDHGASLEKVRRASLIDIPDAM